MSIENNSVIDLISIDSQDRVVLTISDHLKWDKENNHLILLQDKINAYLEVVESGEIYASFPQAKNKSFMISIAFKYKPNSLATDFLFRLSELLTNSGYFFNYYVL